MREKGWQVMNGMRAKNKSGGRYGGRLRDKILRDGRLQIMKKRR